MARGIMADKTEKVVSPISDPNEIKSHDDTIDPLQPSSGNRVAPCTCTKISTMQLFYEMKQMFPTVPDNVVCECVEQNCHNRANCIDCLDQYPNSANVYPQALRNQSKQKKKKQNRTQTIAIGCDKQNRMDTNSLDATKENVNVNVQTSMDENIQLKSANTLNLRNLNCCTRPINRPTRQAPPPPTTISPHQTFQSNQPLNLSVNVIVSPVRQSNQQQQQQQPLSHYSFTLHQPNSNKNISSHPANGSQSNSTPSTVTHPCDNNLNVPSLRYTSSAYDAEIGYQSRLEITVAGSSGTNSNEPVTETANNGNSISLKRSCEITTENNLPSVVASSEFLEETEILQHQKISKQKMIIEMEKDRKRLERMQRELQAIQTPLPEGGLEALNMEIEKLRNDCKLMAQHVEEAGPSYALGETNEAFYRNIYTGQQLPYPQRQPLRPHRPAPSPDFRQQQYQHQQQNRSNNQTNIVAPDPRSISTAAITQSPINPHFSETNADGWICDLCTFQNKYTQQACEACTKPFLSAGNQMNFNGTFVQPTPPYPLTHYMPMPMHSMPPNNNNNIHLPYTYYQPASMPTYPVMHSQYYATPSLTDPHSRY